MSEIVSSSAEIEMYWFTGMMKCYCSLSIKILVNTVAVGHISMLTTQSFNANVYFSVCILCILVLS